MTQPGRTLRTHERRVPLVQLLRTEAASSACLSFARKPLPEQFAPVGEGATENFAYVAVTLG
jgi:hypothetical protein